MAPEKKKEETPFLLQCGKCRQNACKSDEIRVIQNNHRVVISKAFLPLCNIQPHPKPQVCDVLEKKSKIFCRTCNRDWGILASCMGLDNLPVLKISGFTFVNLRTGQRKSVVKWQDFPGLLKDFDFELDVLDQDSSEGAGPSRLY